MSSIFCFSRVTLHSQLTPLNAVSFSLHFKSKPSSSRVPNATFPKLKVFCMREIEAPAVTKESWERLVLKSETPILVEFYASWCGPCRMVHRVIDEIAANYVGRLKCYVLNTDDDYPVAEEYEIEAVPVVLLFKNGEKCDSIVGTMPKEHYVAAIEGLLKS